MYMSKYMTWLILTSRRTMIGKDIVPSSCVQLFGIFMLFCSWIYSTLPENKQILALSATYPEVLAQHLTAYMRNPTFVRMNASDPALLGILRLKTCKINWDHVENFHTVIRKFFAGIRQYYKTVAFHPLPQKSLENKVNALVELLSHINFSQCLIFSNYQMRLVYSLPVSLLFIAVSNFCDGL